MLSATRSPDPNPHKEAATQQLTWSQFQGFRILVDLCHSLSTPDMTYEDRHMKNFSAIEITDNFKLPDVTTLA